MFPSRCVIVAMALYLHVLWRLREWLWLNYFFHPMCANRVFKEGFVYIQTGYNKQRVNWVGCYMWHYHSINTHTQQKTCSLNISQRQAKSPSGPPRSSAGPIAESGLGKATQTSRKHHGNHHHISPDVVLLRNQGHQCVTGRILSWRWWRFAPEGGSGPARLARHEWCTEGKAISQVSDEHEKASRWLWSYNNFRHHGEASCFVKRPCPLHLSEAGHIHCEAPVRPFSCQIWWTGYHLLSWVNHVVSSLQDCLLIV